jgi:hypothetical protein
MYNCTGVMPGMLEFLLLSCGLAGLWAGSEVLIRGAVSLADRFNMSDAVIGMLILAVGTDLPELFVAADASMRSLSGEDLSGIVIGSAIGSSIGQFALVIGTVGFIGFKPRPWRLALRNSVFLIGGLILLAAFSFDGIISRVEGWALAIARGRPESSVYRERAGPRRQRSPGATGQMCLRHGTKTATQRTQSLRGLDVVRAVDDRSMSRTAS